MKKYLLLFFFISLNSNIFCENIQVIFSIPKCGTRLINKFSNLLTKKQGYGEILDHDSLLEKSNNHFFFDHLMFSEKAKLKVNKSDVKILLMIRDPRDQIISNIFYIRKSIKKAYKFFLKIKNRPKKFKHYPNYLAHNHKNTEQFISELILNGSNYYNWAAVRSNSFSVKNIADYYSRFLEWRQLPNVYVVKFENLIGQKGGGSLKNQIEEIQKIASHIGVPINNKKTIKIIKSLFGGTDTFREGKIGSWKKYFSKKNKIEFKKIAGQLLIDLGYEKDFNW